MKAKFSEIKSIIARTPAKYKGKQISNFFNIEVGWFAKASANWAYHVHVIHEENALTQVVSVFGTIQ